MTSTEKHRARAAKREHHAEAEKLELMLRLLLGLGLVGFGALLVQSFLEPAEGVERPSWFGALTGIAVCLSMSVPWTKVPLLSERVKTPRPYLAVVSKLLLSVSLGSLPYLLANGMWLVSLGALGLAALCSGLWFRWPWIAWGWYALILVGWHREVNAERAGRAPEPAAGISAPAASETPTAPPADEKPVTQDDGTT